MEKKNVNHGVYINSLEACDIWESNYRNNRKDIEDHFVGAIPFSLELIHLKKNGLQILHKNKNRPITYDIVNVKFSKNVKSGEDLIVDVPKWIKNKKKQVRKTRQYLANATKKKSVITVTENLCKLKLELKSLKVLYKELKVNEQLPLKEKNPIWDKVSVNELRDQLYKYGFYLDIYDKKAKGYKKVHFLMYKRSTSKSRNGSAWFIREELHKEMSEWSNMRLDFSCDNVDLAGIMAYESLVASTIIDTITINPDSILLIDKVVSKFNDKKVNVIGLKDGMLNCKPNYHPIENELFDGSALLDTSCFVKDFVDRGFVQLRNSWFKCAAFNTDLQGFFKDYFKDEYDTKTIDDMFGNPIKVSEIKMVINPSDLKCLKYSYAVGTKEDMYNYWKEFIRTENDSKFGICKYEKPSKQIDEDDKKNGKIYQQLSYQMVNSLPSNYKQIFDLVQFEIDYIRRLKNNPKKFMQYLKRTKNEMNANEMFMDIYNVNKGIIESQIYRNFKKETIRKYREHIQSGKMRVSGDYCTMGGNLVEYLMAIVGEVKGELKESLVFKENEIFTTLLPAGEVIGFRNPHVSPSNIAKLINIRPDLETEHKNTYNKYFKYFKLTKNIAIVNSCHSLLNDTLNGCDYDGDTILLSDSREALSIINGVKTKYLVPVNNIPLKKNTDINYQLNNESKAKVDNRLSLSQKRIGNITNLGQQACSIMWNEMNSKKPDRAKIKGLLSIVNALAVCSGLAIDGAKREYDLDLDKQINHFRKVLNGMLLTYEVEVANDKTGEVKKKTVRYKPKFWKCVQSDKKNDGKSIRDESKEEYYNCPMDWLFYKMTKLPIGNGVKNPRQLVDLLIEGRIKDGDRRKQANIEQISFESQQDTNHCYAKGFNNEEEEEEMIQQIQLLLEDYNHKISNIKMDEKTMYALLAKISKRTEGLEDNKRPDGNPYPNLRIMLHLYKSYKDLFLQTFKNE